MATAVRERLAALTRAQELTRPGLTGIGGEVVQGGTLHGLIGTMFAPYADRRSTGHEGMILIGPDVPIGANAITNVALVLHELATNAAKYGALSSPEGAVHIDCSLENDELLLIWKERGGPLLDGAPDAEGFGSMLARRIVIDYFGGRICNDWQRDGLVVRLSVPVERLNA